MSRESELRELLAKLKRQFPLRRTLKLRLIAMQAHGSCELSDTERTITICLNRDDILGVQTDTLVHEYGHAREWDQTGNHSKLWGRLHSEVYTYWTQLNI